MDNLLFLNHGSTDTRVKLVSLDDNPIVTNSAGAIFGECNELGFCLRADTELLEMLKPDDSGVIRLQGSFTFEFEGEDIYGNYNGTRPRHIVDASNFGKLIEAEYSDFLQVEIPDDAPQPDPDNGVPFSYILKTKYRKCWLRIYSLNVDSYLSADAIGNGSAVWMDEDVQNGAIFHFGGVEEAVFDNWYINDPLIPSQTGYIYYNLSFTPTDWNSRRKYARSSNPDVLGTSSSYSLYNSITVYPKAFGTARITISDGVSDFAEFDVVVAPPHEPMIVRYSGNPSTDRNYGEIIINPSGVTTDRLTIFARSDAGLSKISTYAPFELIMTDHTPQDVEIYIYGDTALSRLVVANQITEVKQWPSIPVNNIRFYHSVYNSPVYVGSPLLTKLPKEIWTGATSLNDTFTNCTLFDGEDIMGWDFSNIVSLDYCFTNSGVFRPLTDLKFPSVPVSSSKPNTGDRNTIAALEPRWWDFNNNYLARYTVPANVNSPPLNKLEVEGIMSYNDETGKWGYNYNASKILVCVRYNLVDGVFTEFKTAVFQMAASADIATTAWWLNNPLSDYVTIEHVPYRATEFSNDDKIRFTNPTNGVIEVLVRMAPKLPNLDMGPLYKYTYGVADKGNHSYSMILGPSV